jgi:hypothetical protein
VSAPRNEGKRQQLQHRHGRGRDGLPRFDLQGFANRNRPFYPRSAYTEADVATNACGSQRRKGCRAAVYERAGHVTARHFCDWLGRSVRRSQGRLSMSLSQLLQECATRKKGAREQIRAQLSSVLACRSTRARRSKGWLPSQTFWSTKGAVAEGAVIEGGSRVRFCEVFVCHCRFSAAARPTQGIHWVEPRSVGGGGAERRRMRAQQVRECWNGWQRDSWGEGAALLYNSKAASSPCTRLPRLGGRQTQQGEHHD